MKTMSRKTMTDELKKPKLDSVENFSNIYKKENKTKSSVILEPLFN